MMNFLHQMEYCTEFLDNFVEAPLVTLGVNGVWNNDYVM